MKVESRLFVFSGAFMGGMGAAYYLASHEDAGAALLLLSFAAMVFAGVYLARVSLRIPPRPEDRGDATPGDGAGVVGWFPASSAWPLGMGIGAVTITAALVMGVFGADFPAKEAVAVSPLSPLGPVSPLAPSTLLVGAP